MRTDDLALDQMALDVAVHGIRIDGLGSGPRAHAVWRAPRHALEGLTEATAIEVGVHGIRIDGLGSGPRAHGRSGARPGTLWGA